MTKYGSKLTPTPAGGETNLAKVCSNCVDHEVRILLAPHSTTSPWPHRPPNCQQSDPYVFTSLLILHTYCQTPTMTAKSNSGTPICLYKDK